MNKDLLTGRSLWLLGCGAMGGAILSNWLAAGVAPAQITVIDPEPGCLPAGHDVRRVSSLAEAGEQADILVLAIKPQTLPDMMADIAAVSKGTLLISILAGVRSTTLSHLLPEARVIRIMPNLTVRIGQGVSAMYPGAGVSDADRQLLDQLMASTGYATWLDDEMKFDTVTALSGSGPAFLFRFIETLAGAGEANGLEPELAARLALETVAGAANMALKSEEAPGTLRQQVTSPNGVTQAGLDALDGEGELSTLMRATVRAAADRSRVLASEADAVADD